MSAFRTRVIVAGSTGTLWSSRCSGVEVHKRPAGEDLAQPFVRRAAAASSPV